MQSMLNTVSRYFIYRRTLDELRRMDAHLLADAGLEGVDLREAAKARRQPFPGAASRSRSGPASANAGIDQAKSLSRH